VGNKQEPRYFEKGGIYFALNREARKLFKRKKIPFMDYKTKKMYGGARLLNFKQEGKNNAK
tara:strand:+ start:1656 stop:1838 length:183 start_codon:yes stop_codon:yes gene_type:complete